MLILVSKASYILMFHLALTGVCVGVIVRQLYFAWKFLQRTNTLGINLGISSNVHAFFGNVLCAFLFFYHNAS